MKAFNIKRNFQSLYSDSEFAALDGIRAWAVTWVIVYHYLNYYPDINPDQSDKASDQYDKFEMNFMMRFSDMGVDVFFVLSGFLIYHMLAKEWKRDDNTINYSRFLWRRYLRLMPAWIAALVICVPISLVAGDSQLMPCVKWGWTNLLFINNMVGLDDPCLSWSWTIAVEFQFYIVSPLIVIGMLSQPKWGIKLPSLGIILTLGIRLGLFLTNQHYYINTANGGALYHDTYTRCQPYLLGMIACHLYSIYISSNRKDEPKGLLVETPEEITTTTHHWWFDYIHSNTTRYLLHLVFAAIWIATTIVGSKSSPDWPLAANIFVLVFCRTLFGLSVAYFIFMCLTGHSWVLNRILCWRFWAPIARLSYSAYLLQFIGLAIGLVLTYDGSTPPGVIFLIFVGVCVIGFGIVMLLSLFVYLTVEKPFMNFR